MMWLLEYVNGNSLSPSTDNEGSNPSAPVYSGVAELEYAS